MANGDTEGNISGRTLDASFPEMSKRGIIEMLAQEAGNKRCLHPLLISRLNLLSVSPAAVIQDWLLLYSTYIFELFQRDNNNISQIITGSLT